MANIIRFILTADNKAVLAKLDQTAVASERTAGKVSASDDAMAVSNEEATLSFERMRSGVGMLAGALGLGALVFGIKDVVQAGQKWQANQASLQHALKNTGQFTQATLKQINAGAEGLATHGGFGVEEQVTALTQLVSATGSATKAQQLNVAATNLARGAHLDYSVAIKGVEGAMVGQGRAIQKLIGVIVPVTQYTYGWTAAMKAADPMGYQHAVTLNKLATAQEIIGRVQQKYAGQTEAFSHTVAGAFSNIKNSVDILAIRLGVALLPIVAKVAQALMQAVNWVSANWPKIKSVIIAAFSPLTTVIRWLGGVKGAAIAIGLGLAAWATYSAVIRGLAIATALWGVALKAAAVYEAYASLGMGTMTAAAAAFNAVLDINPFILALTAVILITTLVVTHFQWFKTAIANVFRFVSSVVTTAVNWISQKFNLIVGVLRPIASQIAAVLIWPFKNIIEPVWNAIYKNVFKPIIDGVKWLIGAAKTVGRFFGGLFGGSKPSANPAAAYAPGGSASTLPSLYGSGAFPSSSGTSGINSGPNTSVPTSGHQASQSADVHHQPIILKLDGRTIAETVVHFGQKRMALS